MCAARVSHDAGTLARTARRELPYLEIAGAGSLWGTLIGGMSLGVANKLLAAWAGAVMARTLVLVFLIPFIQRRPCG